VNAFNVLQRWATANKEAEIYIKDDLLEFAGRQGLDASDLEDPPLDLQLEVATVHRSKLGDFLAPNLKIDFDLSEYSDLADLANTAYWFRI
jgi:hypothetical protein